MKIKMLDLTREYRNSRKEYIDAIERVFDNGSFILGSHVESFENAMSSYIGSSACIGVGNGTDALRLALIASGIKPGDEVITTPFTFIATAETIVQSGAVPVFADIDGHTLNIDPQAIEQKITEKTSAILPVHLYGNPADMDPIMKTAEEHGLIVIEDCAQSIGASYKGRNTGSIGNCGTFSFFPTKNLGCPGDGGAVTTSDTHIENMLRILRQHGAVKKYTHHYEGFNSRLDAIHAEILNVKIKNINEKNKRRQEIAQKYKELIEGPVRYQQTADKSSHVYHQFTVITPLRDELQAYLKSEGIGTAIHYPIPLHKQKIFSSYANEDYPNAQRAASEVLSLPIYPELRDDEVNYIAEKINDFFSRH